MEIEDQLFPDGLPELYRIEAMDSSDRIKPVKRIVTESWNRKKNHLMIEGEGGIGKTVTLLFLPDKFVPHKVPAVYVQLHELKVSRDKDGRVESIEKLENYLKKKVFFDDNPLFEQFKQLTMKPWNKGPQILMLLDGFNELAIDTRVDIGADIIRWSERPGVQIITSSRFDIHSYVPLGGGYGRIHLQPLRRSVIQAFLKKEHLASPADGDEILWNLINYPLMLTLYARTEKAIANIDKDTECQSFMPNNSAGAIIWNYLQREIWRYREPPRALVKCVIATEYVAPYIAWKMLKDNNRFSISKRDFREFVGEACSKAASLAKDQFRSHISDILCETDCPFPQEKEIRDFLRTDLRLFVDKGQSYSLMHQQFRDALVALHLINVSYSSSELPVEWKSHVDFYVMQFVSQLASQDEADKLWEQNLKMGEHIDSATINMLELQNLLRKSDFSRLSFKGLDLRNISLYRYRLPGTRTLLLPVQSSLNKGLIVSEKTFYPTSHLDEITALAITEDGTKCISASKDSTLRVWELASGLCQMVLEGHSDPIYTLAVTRDGKKCVSGADDSSICIWDLESGKCLHGPIKAHNKPINSLAISDDGSRCVSGSWDKTLRIFDLATGDCLPAPMTGHMGPVWKVAISADGSRCASGSEDGTIRIWNMENGLPLGKPLEGHKGSVNTVAFNALGDKVVSGSFDHTLRIWDVKTGKCQGEPLIGHEGYVWQVSVTPDGERCVSRSEDRTLRVWDLITGKPLKGFAAHELPIHTFAISPDGKKCVSGSYDTLHIWDLETRKRIGKPLIGHKGLVTAIAITPDGKRCVSGSEDRTIRVWDLGTGLCLGEPQKPYDGEIHAVAVGRSVVVFRSLDATIRIWDLQSWKCRHVIEEKQKQLYPIAVSPDDKICYLEETRDVEFRRQEGRNLLSLIEDHSSVIHALDLTTGSFSGTFVVKDSAFISTISPNGQRCIGGNHQNILSIWDLKTGTTLRMKRPDRIDAFSPDGKRFVGLYRMGRNHRLYALGDTKTGQALKECPFENRSMEATFSANGKTIVFHRDTKVYFWSIEDGTVKNMMFEHSRISKLKVSAKGDKCVTLSLHGELHLWNPEKYTAIPLPGVQGRILSFAITSDGKRCVAGSDEGVLYEWDLTKITKNRTAKVLPLFLPESDFSQADFSSSTPAIGMTLQQNGAIVSSKNVGL
ncbi:MAG: hypothetical protein IKW89_03875 [Bacteroidales bacterium]|nr:hypothetical protein [Bacteroidales bacterium]